MGSSVQRLKENKQRERGGSENNEKRKGDVCFEKKKASAEREGWQWRWRSLVVICGRGAASRCVPLTHL